MVYYTSMNITEKSEKYCKEHDRYGDQILKVKVSFKIEIVIHKSIGPEQLDQTYTK